MSVVGKVSNISRGSLHDGPGVRTVVYLKGCAMRCRWCHNPETFSKNSEIMYAASKCIHCGRCVAVCPKHHIIDGNDMIFERKECIGCGKCADVCPSGALSLCGDSKTVEEVFKEVRKDAHFFKASGGGLTISGGECLLQPEFTAGLLQTCHQENIHTVIESAFFVPWENVEKVIPYVDQFFADLKIPDAEKHCEYTGQRNERIIENIRRLSEVHKKIVIRIPLIPGVNDSEEDMKDFGEIIRTFSQGIVGVELLRYNYLASSKYQLIGKEYISFGEEAQNNEKMNTLKAALENVLAGKCEVFYR